MHHDTVRRLLSLRPARAARPAAGRTSQFPLPSERHLMKIHEYQGKEILRNFGVPVPRGIPASPSRKPSRRRRSSAARSGSSRRRSTPAAAARAAASRSPSRSTRCKSYAGQILGMQLMTHQTGPEGQKVRRLLIEEGADIKKELLRRRMVTDRATQSVALMASQRRRHGHRGSRAHARPEKIHKVVRSIRSTGLTDAQADDIARKIGMPGRLASPQARRRAARSSTSASWRPTPRWPRSTR